MTKILPDINENIVNDEIRWHGISLLKKQSIVQV